MQLEVNITGKSFASVAGKRHDVLDNVTFTLNAGEVGVLFGPSGCGKSTLLRILAGLDANYQGHVARSPGMRLGMVFQEPRLLPWRTVEENVRIAAPHVDDGTLSALFEVLELSVHRNHFPGELSLGPAASRSPAPSPSSRISSSSTSRWPRSTMHLRGGCATRSPRWWPAGR